jgi:hypothetical protein
VKKRLASNVLCIEREVRGRSAVIQTLLQPAYNRRTAGATFSIEI